MPNRLTVSCVTWVATEKSDLLFVGARSSETAIAAKYMKRVFVGVKASDVQRGRAQGGIIYAKGGAFDCRR